MSNAQDDSLYSPGGLIMAPDGTATCGMKFEYRRGRWDPELGRVRKERSGEEDSPNFLYAQFRSQSGKWYPWERIIRANEVKDYFGENFLAVLNGIKASHNEAKSAS